ncbi:DUF3035 domain-containing protein [Sphingomicrobium aestuariivivum]|uniref:DUF3035 domain-containing protein n=1 Tax=Sphingomicrobium aestuariivivum TaxID=1582356 RepID=UPI001FD667A5|nr:DUF3035 domain-containing protein [Sphingomicrobium aestuariivivum]MCJ8190723.1 DUF3035 domain-containing protein [Sphingomicrobium aestuariivivum]
MRKALAFTFIAATALSACASNQGSLDEYAVTRNAPLVIPPDYTLQPPRAGTVSTSAGEAQTRALEALFGGPAPRSAAERMVVSQAADGGTIPLGARSTAGDPDTRVVDKGATTQDILNAPEGDGQDAAADTPQ